MTEEHLYVVIKTAMAGIKDPHWQTMVRRAMDELFMADPFAAAISKAPLEAPKVSSQELVMPILKTMCCDCTGDHVENWLGILRQAGAKRSEINAGIVWIVERARKDNARARFPSQCLPYVNALENWLNARRDNASANR